MKLYKYESLANLWRVLDMVLNGRLYCAHWDKLNDPLEGRYEIWLREGENIREEMTNAIEKERNVCRIAALSKDPTQFLLWSHYANGHKGVAVEVDIPRSHSHLEKVHYLPYWYTPVFSEASQATEYTKRHLFTEKGLEWSYEKEYRIVTENEFFLLSKPVTRILVGPKADAQQIETLKKAVFRKGRKVSIVSMQCDVLEGQMRVFVPNSPLEKLARKFALQEQKEKKS